MSGPEQAGPPSWTGGEASLPGLAPEAPQLGIQHPPGTRPSPLNKHLKTTGWLWCLDLHSLPSQGCEAQPTRLPNSSLRSLLGPFLGHWLLAFLQQDNMKNIETLPSSIQQSWVHPMGHTGKLTHHKPETPRTQTNLRSPYLNSMDRQHDSPFVGRKGE